MAGRTHHLEAVVGLDPVRNENIGHGRQGAGGRAGVAYAEIVALAAFQDVVQGDSRTLLGDQHRLVDALSALRHHPRQHVGVGAVDRLQRRQGREPADLGLVEAHGLDQGGVVAGEERLHLEARLGLHVVDQGLPDLGHGGLVLGRQDGEVQRLVGRLFGAAGQQADGDQGGEGLAHPLGAYHFGRSPSQKTSSISGP